MKEQFPLSTCDPTNTESFAIMDAGLIAQLEKIKKNVRIILSSTGE